MLKSDSEFLACPGESTFTVSRTGIIKRSDGSHVALATTTRGYLRFLVPRTRRQMFVHRAVAMTFCAGYRDGLFVNHKDGCKTNNAADNLEWVSKKENSIHAAATGLLPRAMTERLVVELRERCKSGVSVKELALEYGLGRSYLSAILTGRYYGYFGGPIKTPRRQLFREPSGFVAMSRVAEEMRLTKALTPVFVDEAVTYTEERLKAIETWIRETWGDLKPAEIAEKLGRGEL